MWNTSAHHGEGTHNTMWKTGLLQVSKSKPKDFLECGYENQDMVVKTVDEIIFIHHQTPY